MSVMIDRNILNCSKCITRCFVLTLFCTILTSEIYAQKSFIPKYNDGSRITLIESDTVIVFSVIRQTEIKCKSKCFYSYFINQSIHRNRGSYTGKLLHGEFVKHLRDGFLLEQGIFNEGLKDGVWKYWHNNGELASVSVWRKGQGKGRQLVYGEDNKLLQKQKWQDGRWVLTRKYAMLERREQKEIDRREKKKIRKQKKEQKKIDKKADLSKKDSGRFLFFMRKAKENDYEVEGILPNEDVTIGGKKSNFSFLKKGNKKMSTKKKKTLFGFLSKGEITENDVNE